MLSPAHKNNEAYVSELIGFLPGATYSQALAAYGAVVNDPHLDPWVEAQIAEIDRYFLMTWVLRLGAQIPRIYHEWIYGRVREVEACPDGCLDLWAREHCKSTTITFGGSIQEIIKSQGEITIGIFSHNAAHARDKFVVRLKREMENNPNLPRLWPDVFWANPKKEAPVWSRDGGLVVKRKGNPAEATISGWGLVDGQPTGSHFGLMIYDDVVTEKAVTSPEMILKTTEMWELSTFMTQEQSGEKPPRVWYIGTRYNYADTYGVMLTRGVATPRVHPATQDGTPGGKPVFLTEAQWAKKRADISERTIACQMLQNPLAGEQQEFKPAWIRPYEVRPETLNVYILVDPANSKKKASCRTAMAVVGVDHALNKYLLDGLCHKLDLNERWQALKFFRHKWLRSAGVQTVRVGYERYGMQADIQHFETMMRFEKCAFEIEEVNWAYDSEQAKDDRIRRLIPDHQNWRFFYPIGKNKDGQIEYEIQETSLQRQMSEQGKGYLVARPVKRKNEDGRIYNLVEYLVTNEYNFFPATTAKDFLDAMSRIYDMQISAPIKLDRGVELVPAFAGEVG